MITYNLVYHCDSCNSVIRSDKAKTKLFIDAEDIKISTDHIKVGSGFFSKRYKKEYVHECYTKRTDSEKTFGVVKFVGVECSVKA